MLHLLIYLLILGSTTIQAQDSLKLIPVIKWKLDRLLDVYHFDLPACETAVTHFKASQDSAMIALQEGSKLIVLRTTERNLKSTEATLLREALSSQKELTKEVGKQAKRKGRLQGLGIGGVIVVLVLLL